MQRTATGSESTSTRRRLASGLTAALVAIACGGPGAPAEPPPPVGPETSGTGDGTTDAPATEPTVEEARAFIEQVNAELKVLWTEASRVAWVKSTYITHDTEQLEAKMNERTLEYTARKIKEARRFEKLDLPPDLARQFYILKYSAGVPSPDDPAKRAELAEILTKMESAYGKGEYCSPKLKGKGRDATSECLDLGDLSKLLANSRDYGLLLEAWQGWRTISPPIRPMYERFVSLGNEGARDLGFTDMGQIWKGRYDMSGEQFIKEMDRLWLQVKPLYDELHCYVRTRLQKKYGKDKIKDGEPIPAHVLGNMWAQEWTNIYELVEPHPGPAYRLPDLTKQLKAKNYVATVKGLPKGQRPKGAKGMVELAEGFFTSLGMSPLPATFYERSLFTQPRDRNVVCHASAWDVDFEGDLRIKMCIRVSHEDLVTIHHELGHNYYYKYYNTLPILYQGGANDGFHEGIGDTLALSVTPSYLAKVGLYDRVPKNDKAEINELMKRALEGVAFLPFGKMIDTWRWDVFSGKTPPGEYNTHWWELREKYQGIAPPVERSATDFDPGAKYHIPSNVPYTRYFIARILQYQFHRALCKAAGHEGPLHQCSIYGSKKAGEKMMAMLKLGQSKPWPEALAAISGEREMDATAIIDYYAPLMAHLKKQNEGQTCGW